MPVTRCPQHRKPSYSAWSLADKVRRRSNARNGRDDEGSVYFCCESGGYHVTSWTRSDQDRLVAGRPGPSDRDDVLSPAGDNPGGNSGDSWGRWIDYPKPVDNVGEATATRRRLRLETLLVGPAARRDPVRKVRRSDPPARGGPPEAHRRDHTSQGVAVTLPDEARPITRRPLDTPSVGSSERASHGDEIRPFDEYDDDDERAS